MSWSGLMKGATWPFLTELELYAAAAICPPLLSSWPQLSWRYVSKHTWRWKSALLQGGAGVEDRDLQKEDEKIWAEERLCIFLSSSFFHFFKFKDNALQCCVSFCRTATWICIHSLPFWVSLLPNPHPTLLGHHRIPSWTPCAIEHLPVSFSFTQSSVLVSVLPEKPQCICSNATLSAGPTLSFPCCEHKSILYVWVSLPPLQVHSFINTFFLDSICMH